MKYMNRKTNQVATVVERDDKFKTMTFQFEDGTTKAYTFSTIKRYWKEVKEDAPAQVNTPVEAEQTDAPVEAEQPFENTPIFGDGAFDNITVQQVEEVKPEKPAKATKVRKAREMDAGINQLITDILNMTEEIGGTVYEANNIKMRALKIDGHMFARITYGNTYVNIHTRSKAVGELEVTPTAQVNHMFDWVFKFAGDADRDKIKEILVASRDYQINKKTKKQEEK